MAARLDTPFFCFRDGRRFSRSAAQGAFRRLRASAGISREGGPYRQPRLHDLRHSAAVHRLIAWYRVHLVDPQTGTVLCRLFPQYKAANASGLRRGLQPIASEPGKPSPSPSQSPSPPVRAIGPLLERMIDRQAAIGLPPAYLPKDEGDDA